MIKSILSLLAASTSFVALLLITNLAIAATPIDNPLNRGESSIVSLNVISPSLQSMSNSNDSLMDHLGCSCAICTQGIQEATSNLS